MTPEGRQRHLLEPAEKIERDPRLLGIAHRNLDCWQAKWADRTPIWVGQRQEILSQPWPEIAALLTEPGEAAASLKRRPPNGRCSHRRFEPWLSSGQWLHEAQEKN